MPKTAKEGCRNCVRMALPNPYKLTIGVLLFRGYRLMAKMGYQAGQGLGSDATGRPVPIDVDLKASKAGLGIDEEKKRRRTAAEAARLQAEAKRARLQEASQTTFKESTLSKFSAAAAERHLTAARKSVETLDDRAGIGRHHLWPPLPSEPDSPSAEKDGASTGQSAPDIGADQEADPWEMQSATQRLTEVTQYLRDRYHYCIYCGCQYDSEEDLKVHCPGLDESDH